MSATHTTIPAAYVSYDGAAARVGLSARYIRAAAARGELVVHRFGRAVRLAIDDVDTWAASKADTGPDDYIRRLVASAPPLTEGQRADLAALLRGAR